MIKEIKACTLLPFLAWRDYVYPQFRHDYTDRTLGVTLRDYANCFMLYPELSSLFKRDLFVYNKSLDGDSEACNMVTSWIYFDFSLILINMKQSLMKSQKAIDPLYLVLEGMNFGDSYLESLEEIKVEVLESLDGKRKLDSGLTLLGTSRLAKIKEDPSLLDDQLISQSILYRKIGGVE